MGILLQLLLLFLLLIRFPSLLPSLCEHASISPPLPPLPSPCPSPPPPPPPPLAPSYSCKCEVCSTWTWLNRGSSRRSASRPLGDESRRSVRDANIM
eukprot:2257017-Pyramimonas_sp.AAC.1